MEAADEIFREIVEQQKDPVVTFTPEGRLIYVNPAYCELVGKTKEELSGGVFMPVTERQFVGLPVSRSTRGRGNESPRMARIHADGSTIGK